MIDTPLVKVTHGTWKDFRLYMDSIDGILRADDARFKGTALVIHREGMLLQDGSSIEVHEIGLDGDKVLVVFGEHMRATFFEVDMVSGWANFTMHHPYEVLRREEEEEEEYHDSCPRCGGGNPMYGCFCPEECEASTPKKEE